MSRTNGWAGYNTTGVEALFDLWSLDPANSTLGSTLLASGSTPPAVTLSGTLTTPYGVRVEITGAGVLGVALFRVSLNNGAGFVASGVPTAATYTIPGTAIVLNFPAGTYATDNVYRATVAQGNDTSPRALHVTNATSANQPFFTLNNASFNNKPTWDGPNSNSTCLDTALFSPTIDAPVSYVVVGVATAASILSRILARTDTGTNSQNVVLSGTTGQLSFGPTSTATFASHGLKPFILIGQIDAAARASLWVNGVYCGTKVVSGGVPINSHRVMNGVGLTQYLTGSVADIRSASRVFTMSERRNIFKFFGDKHAIPIAFAS